MNKKLLINIFLVGLAGIIIYQVLLNFILPIALFVVLIPVLKFLIKGSDNSGSVLFSKFSNNNSETSLEKNVNSQMPIETPPEDVKSIIEESEQDQAKTPEEEIPPEDVKSIIEESEQDQAKTPEEEIPIEEPKRVDTEKTMLDNKPIELSSLLNNVSSKKSDIET